MPPKWKLSHGRKPPNKLSRQQRNRIFREIREYRGSTLESSPPMVPDDDIEENENPSFIPRLNFDELITPPDEISADDFTLPLLDRTMSDHSFDDISSDQSSENSYDSIPDENEERPSFRQSLACWAVHNSIAAIACDELLKILRAHPCFYNLPKSAKSLLDTLRQTSELLDVPPGKYLHFGLELAIVNILDNTCKDDVASNLEVDISTDGANLDHSGNSQIWPIQCRVANIPKSPTEVIGIYRGNKKPDNSMVFFERFIEEANVLIRNGGVFHHESKKSFTFRAFIADAPARAFILNHMGHTSQNPCSKCCVTGEYHQRRMTFCGVVLRTDEQYSRQEDEEHHKQGISPLSHLPIGMVSQVPFEYMHLVLLGIVKRLLSAWVDGKFSNESRLCAANINLVSTRLIHLSSYYPRKFARPPRDLKFYQRYKATELRQFLLYTSPVALFGILSDDLYKHFLLLHMAMRILASAQPSEIQWHYAESAVRIFVTQCEHLYGRSFVSYNVHGLLHLIDDAKLLGPVDAYSTFPYENNMRVFWHYCRKPDMPLQQIANRQAELAQRVDVRGHKNSHKTVALERHYEGRLPMDSDENEMQQYRRLDNRKFVLTRERRDNYCILKDLSVCIVLNIFVRRVEHFLVVKKFDRVEALYDAALPSTSVGFYKCSALREGVTLVRFEDVMTKCYFMPHWQPRRFTENGQEQVFDDVFAVGTMSCEVKY